MSNLQILHVVPLDKLMPDTPDYFLYFGDAPLNSIVKIPFRKKYIEGLVINKIPITSFKLSIKKAPFELKPIKEIIRTQAIIFDNQFKFAYWLKNYCNLSLSHAFCLLLQWHNKLDKEIEVPNIPQIKNKFQHKVFLLKKFEKSIFDSLPLAIFVPNEDYFDVIKNEISSFISDAEIIIADLSLPKKAFSKVIEKILKSEKVIFIGNKNAIFLPWRFLRKIIIYEDGNFFYKDSFTPPYFDYSILIEKLAEIMKVPLYKISSFPSLNTLLNLQSSKKEFLQFSEKIEFISKIDFKKIEDLINEYQKIIIFSPQKILAKRISCIDCHAEVLCPRCNIPLVISENKVFCKSCFYQNNIPSKCGVCKGDRLEVRILGGEWIAKNLEKRGLPVIFIKNKKDINAANRFKRFIIVGSQALLTPKLIKAEVLIFLNFDWSFNSPDLFLKEKYIRALEFLSRFVKKIFVITELKNEVLKKIINGEIIDEILKERLNEFLPPYSRVIKLISRLRNLFILNKRMLEIRKELEKRINENKKVKVLGPVLPYLPKRLSRYQLELILKVDKKINIRKLLEGIKVEEFEVDSYSFI